MAVYHISKNNTPVVCQAKIKCRLGGEHFNSKKEAEEHITKKDAENHRTIPKAATKKKMTTSTFITREKELFRKINKSEKLVHQNAREINTYKAAYDIADKSGDDAVKVILNDKLKTLKENSEKLKKDLKDAKNEYDKFMKLPESKSIQESIRRTEYARRLATSSSYSSCSSRPVSRSSC